MFFISLVCRWFNMWMVHGIFALSTKDSLLPGLLSISLVPRLFGGGEKSAWYPLFAHAFNLNSNITVAANLRNCAGNVKARICCVLCAKWLAPCVDFVYKSFIQSTVSMSSLWNQLRRSLLTEYVICWMCLCLPLTMAYQPMPVRSVFGD